MKGIFSILTLGILISLNSCDSLKDAAAGWVRNALTDTTFTTEIPQLIGGTLQCRVRYANDFQSYSYTITYAYQDNSGNTATIGSGRYSGRKWPANEQLQTVGPWVVLKTGEGYNADKVIIGILNQPERWQKYAFSPATVEQEPLWQSQSINSDPDNSDSAVFIEGITSGGVLSLQYQFAVKDRLFSYTTGTRMIEYRIDPETGKPAMTSILTSK
jgi:hypothetical protein